MYVHTFANPCYRDKTVEDVIARKSWPLQWDPSAEMASFWPTLKRIKNAGLDASGRLSGRASGRLSGRHVGPSNLSWPEGVKWVDQTEPPKNHQLTIQTDTNMWVENRKARFRRYVELWTAHLQHKYQRLELHLHLVTSPVFFHVKPTTNINTCFKVVAGNGIDQGKVEKVRVLMGITFALQCCRAATFYTVEPALHTPIFKKKC